MLWNIYKFLLEFDEIFAEESSSCDGIFKSGFHWKEN